MRTSDGTVVFIIDLAPGETSCPEKVARANEILRNTKIDPRLFPDLVTDSPDRNAWNLCKTALKKVLKKLSGK